MKALETFLSGDSHNPLCCPDISCPCPGSQPPKGLSPTLVPLIAKPGSETKASAQATFQAKVLPVAAHQDLCLALSGVSTR